MMAKHKLKKILSGVQAIGESPCDSCIHVQECADQRLACKQFESWTDDGIVRGGKRNPDRQTYSKVYYGATAASWEESREIAPRSDQENAA